MRQRESAAIAMTDETKARVGGGEKTRAGKLLYAPFAAHEHTDGPALAIVVLHELCHARTSDEFARERDCRDEDDVAPILAGVEKAQVGLQTG
jgi:hypothetical protein